MIRFFAPDIASDPILPETESQHCVKVLRTPPGDIIEVVDGTGFLYRCRMVEPHPKHALVEVVERLSLPLPWSECITVAIAPTKHMDRMEWLVEKLVETGVNRIIPIRTRYSERKEIKPERLQKIAISAMKQSLKAVLPDILPMTQVSEVIKADYGSTQKFMAYCDPDIPRIGLADAYVPGSNALILIGPEGDFSKEEIEMALAHDFSPVTFGENRLRTETAALYGCTAIHVLNTAAHKNI